MGGVLTHLIVSAILLFMALAISKRWLYGLAIAVGQLLPDGIKFGITGLKIWSANPSAIVRDKLFWTLEKFGSDYHTWLNFGILIVAISWFLYYMGRIKKKEAEEINWAYLYLVIGIAIHLIIDILIIEKSYWI